MLEFLSGCPLHYDNHSKMFAGQSDSSLKRYLGRFPTGSGLVSLAAVQDSQMILVYLDALCIHLFHWVLCALGAVVGAWRGLRYLKFIFLSELKHKRLLFCDCRVGKYIF